MPSGSAWVRKNPSDQNEHAVQLRDREKVPDSKLSLSSRQPGIRCGCFTGTRHPVQLPGPSRGVRRVPAVPHGTPHLRGEVGADGQQHGAVLCLCFPQASDLQRHLHFAAGISGVKSSHGDLPAVGATETSQQWHL